MLARTQALIQSAVFTVDRNQSRASPLCGFTQELTSEDHRFFICERDGLSRGKGAIGGGKARGSNRRRNNDVHIACRGNLLKAGWTRHHFRDCDTQMAATFPKFVDSTDVRDADYRGVKCRRLLCEQIDRSVCRESENPEAIRQVFDNAKRVLPYRARGANDCKTFHRLNNQ